MRVINPCFDPAVPELLPASLRMAYATTPARPQCELPYSELEFLFEFESKAEFGFALEGEVEIGIVYEFRFEFELVGAI